MDLSNKQTGHSKSVKGSPPLWSKEPETPQLTRRDPSLSTVGPGAPPSSSKDPHVHAEDNQPPQRPFWKVFLTVLYNPSDKTCCYRTGASWGKLAIYAIIYLLFLATYFMLMLYISLTLIKLNPPSHEPVAQGLVYSNKIGITATPTSEHTIPLIWFRRGNSDDIKMYTKSLDELLLKHRRDSQMDISRTLGPCGTSPYGYADEPCVLIRTNKRFAWAAKPLSVNSTNAKEAPASVQKWMTEDQTKYWLYCDGVQSYDKEHVGRIKYYPDPPGFDASLFPVDMSARSPLIGVQFSNYTEGVSVEFECKLWYDSGHSAISFVLYVAPKNSLKLLRMTPAY